MKSVLIGFLLFNFLFLHITQAQYKNIKLDERSSGTAICEPAIAINPRNPMNIVAAAVPDNLYFTLDGGKTWEKKKLTSSFGVSGYPVIAVDPKGTFYYFHLAGDGPAHAQYLDAIICNISEDGGKTWDNGTPVGMNVSKDQHKPWADVNSKGEIALTWIQYDKYGSEGTDCKSSVMISTSSNGKKWTKPVEISAMPGDCGEAASVKGAVAAIGDDKKIFVTWLKNGRIFMDRSFDDGYMWLSEDIEIAKQNVGSGVEGQSGGNGLPLLKIDKTKSAHKGLLFLVYDEISKGKQDRDITLIKSARFGDFWTTPEKVGADQNHRHQYMPSLCVDAITGNVYILYYDRGAYEDNQTDVMLAYSSDSGNTFRTVKISETPFTPDSSSLFGSYIGISAHKGIIAPVWTRMDEGKTSIMTTVIKQEELPK